MTDVIPSRAFDIWRRLYTRFRLEPEPAEGSRPGVGMVIVPVTMVDKLLEVVVPTVTTLDLTGVGDLHVPAYTVPTGRRATVLHARRGISATITWIELSIDGSLFSVTAAGVVEAFLGSYVQVPLVLDAGDSIGLHETGNAGDGARLIEILVLEEEAF